MSLSTQTRNNAYHEIHDDGTAQSQADKVLNAYREAKDRGLTRYECELKTGLRVNAVCGRTKELLDKGLLKETELTRRNNDTGKENAVLVAKEYFDWQIHCKLTEPRQTGMNF